jgi:hypothetical protein
MPEISENAWAIPEIPQLPKYFQKWLFSSSACDINIFRPLVGSSFCLTGHIGDKFGLCGPVLGLFNSLFSIKKGYMRKFTVF